MSKIIHMKQKGIESMKFRRTAIVLWIALMGLSAAALFGGDPTKPVSPNASPEAKALLKFIHSISEKYTLTGQHNYPNTRDRNSQFAARYVGETPVVWSTDMGFAEDGDTDSYLARPDIVDEAIRQHQKGSVITICWHAVPPTADEPVTFRPQPDADPEKLESVQGKLLDQQFQDVLTPGTVLYNRWAAQVDSVAYYLKKLQAAKVPVLWRPYHEMNGDWFWWGGRYGQYSTRALYKQLFDRLVNYHKLNNLIWVWSVDRVNRPEMNFSKYYPGNECLDILSLDVYGSDFNQVYYDSLMALSQGKPLVLGEVGNPPALEVYETQPNWTLWVIWAGMVRNTSKAQHEIFANSSRMLNLEDPAYHEMIAPYRKACKLPLLPLEEKTINLSGTWILNEEQSALDNWGASNLPYKMKIVQSGNDLMIEKSFVVEWGDDRVTEEKFTLDGKGIESTFWNSPRITTAILSEGGDKLTIESKVTFTMEERTSEMVTTELWSMKEKRNVLVIEQSSKSFRGDRQITMIYNRM
jgi:mannan endo-1,4-beta-mannosidase